MSQQDKDDRALAITLTVIVVVLLAAAALACSNIDGADQFITENNLILG